MSSTFFVILSLTLYPYLVIFFFHFFFVSLFFCRSRTDVSLRPFIFVPYFSPLLLSFFFLLPSVVCYLLSWLFSSSFCPFFLYFHFLTFPPFFFPSLCPVLTVLLLVFMTIVNSCCEMVLTVYNGLLRKEENTKEEVVQWGGIQELELCTALSLRSKTVDQQLVNSVN